MELIGRVAATRPGRRLTVIGIRESSNHAVSAMDIDFVDIEEIRYSLAARILRMASLTDLAPEGELLPPFQPLPGRLRHIA